MLFWLFLVSRDSFFLPSTVNAILISSQINAPNSTQWRWTCRRYSLMRWWCYLTLIEFDMMCDLIEWKLSVSTSVKFVLGQLFHIEDIEWMMIALLDQHWLNKRCNVRTRSASTTITPSSRHIQLIWYFLILLRVSLGSVDARRLNCNLLLLWSRLKSLLNVLLVGRRGSAFLSVCNAQCITWYFSIQCNVQHSLI